VSRLFRNPLYLDPEAAREFLDGTGSRPLARSPEHEQRLRALREASRIDYANIMHLKRAVFAELHRRFAAAPDDAPQQRAYRRYLEQQGNPLHDFATFLAIAARFSPEWRRWPDDLRHPTAAGVPAFRRANADEIDLHRYVQFELDRQLAAAAHSARDGGLAVGLLGDLAIGVGANGSDTWAFPDLFVDEARIGAPPDEYSPSGQDWGLAPLNPLRLVERRCDYWIGLVRQAMRHMGALRIDHVMGLFRQYWVPAGARPEHGAYIRYPSEHLLAVLALESARQQCIVVGEDLGTVPKGLPAILDRWGIQSTRLLYFEREKSGAFRPAARYSPRAVVSINTHDHAPFAGFWSGRDLDLRYQTGVIPSDQELGRARAERAAARGALLRRLRAERVLPGDTPPELFALDQLTGAVHTFLARTPSPLLSLAMDDLLGETEPVNLPGVRPDKYPSWTRRARLPLESLETDPSISTALGDMRLRTRKSR
jgi:4-alpha-glucanotransferase